MTFILPECQFRILRWITVCSSWVCFPPFNLRTASNNILNHQKNSYIAMLNQGAYSVVPHWISVLPWNRVGSCCVDFFHTASDSVAHPRAFCSTTLLCTAAHSQRGGRRSPCCAAGPRCWRAPCVWCCVSDVTLPVHPTPHPLFCVWDSLSFS